MTIEALQNNDIVTLRNGEKLVYFKGSFSDYSANPENTVMCKEQFRNDMTYKTNLNFDIVKVERQIGTYIVYLREEKEVKEMTVAEISKALGYEVKIVKEEK